MRIGAYLRLFGRASGEAAAPRWASIRQEALAAEAAGFDLVVLEDGALYLDPDGNAGLWEAMTTAAAIAASTATIEIGHAVLNNPYRHPTLVARCAATLDEISGGRYRLGIGLGNTPDEYPRFGIEADRRYSRFAEAVTIIRQLLRDGRTSFEGEFYDVPDAELVLRGPRDGAIPIVIAAQGPKMLRLVATHADEWNWWTTVEGGDVAGGLDDVQRLSAELDAACADVGRDPATLRRSLDIFSVEPPRGSPASAKLAAQLLAYGAATFDEVRCSIRTGTVEDRPGALTAMSEVVRRVHEG